MNDSMKLREIIRLGKLMTEIADEDLMLEKILTEARHFASADAGSIYKCDQGYMHLRYSQNETLQKKMPFGKKLIYTTMSFPIDKSKVAGYVALTGELVNIANVYKIPKEAPYRFGKAIDDIAGYRAKSMLTIPLKTGSRRIIGVLQLINAMDNKGSVVSFKAKDIPFIEHLANTAAVALEKAELTRQIILRMISMAELRDPTETGPHVNRVGAYSAELYEEWAIRHNVPEAEREKKKDMLRIAAMLHDVGKVAIPDQILKKPGGFTPEERKIMMKHSIIGYNLFKSSTSELEIMAAEIALTHHESWDGSGYPGKIDYHTGKPLKASKAKKNGLVGEEIPLWGRIVKIADVYDALSRKRCYKEAWDQKQVLDELENCSGCGFDPELIVIFESIMDRILNISNSYADHDDSQDM